MRVPPLFEIIISIARGTTCPPGIENCAVKSNLGQGFKGPPKVLYQKNVCTLCRRST